MVQLQKMGYAVDVVQNGFIAVTAVAPRSYSLILIDCQMPEMDGFEATYIIRDAETLSDGHTPIIAMTANSTPEDCLECIRACMDDFISKPVEADMLRSIVERWLPQAISVSVVDNLDEQGQQSDDDVASPPLQ